MKNLITSALVLTLSACAQPQAEPQAELQAELQAEPQAQPPMQVDVSMYIGKADEFGAMGQWPEALAMMNKADSLKPEDYSILHMRGKLKGHSGDYAGAVEDLDRAIDLCTVEKQRRILFLSRAGIYKKAGHLDLACSDWKLAGELGEFDYKEHCTQLEQGSGVQ